MIARRKMTWQPKVNTSTNGLKSWRYLAGCVTYYQISQRIIRTFKPLLRFSMGGGGGGGREGVSL